MSGSDHRKYGWQDILASLARLDQENRSVLERNVLVGGAACFFYRDQLRQINDPDFRIPSYLPEEEKLWLSHDADFATTDPQDIPLSIGDMPLGTVQCGISVPADEFLENARAVKFVREGTTFTVLLADPLDLWREKEAIIHRLSRPQDRLHLEVLELFLQWEMAHYAEQIVIGEFSPDQWIARAKEVKMRYYSILKNQKLIDRLLAVKIPEITDFVSAHTPNSAQREWE